MNECSTLPVSMTHPVLNCRPLGSTGIRVSEISFGCGPVSGLMTGGDRELQRRTIRHALEAGINWFDTAATYGNGQSETNLGAVLRELGAGNTVHVATKIRLMAQHFSDIKESVKASVITSLKRLGLSRITLIQLHNSITSNRGDQPTSITPRDVLGQGGVLEAFEDLRAEGLVAHVGLTGLGEHSALLEVIRAGPWAAMQVCLSLAEPRQTESDLISACVQQGIGVIAIRVLAGGALAGQPPSAHTFSTKFFPLDVYRRDQKKAAEIAQRLTADLSLKEAAIRYALGDAAISTALIGFACPEQIEEAVRFASAGPMPPSLLRDFQSEFSHA
jgi:aryl-alcohol dehydrogenase-like predicted oxidoreductase